LDIIKKGKKEGLGTYHFNEESYIDGTWTNNKLNGYGEYYYKNKKIIGIWRNGRLVQITHSDFINEEIKNINFNIELENIEIQSFNDEINIIHHTQISNWNPHLLDENNANFSISEI